MNMRFCPICRRSYGALHDCPADRVPLQALASDYPAPGTVIDGLFQLLAPVAEGGMSRIYRAQSIRQSLPVAVKVLDPRLAAEPYTVERFYREARVSLLLDHPNVVQVHTFGLTAEGNHVIVMEFLGGESLGQVMQRLHHLPWERALHVAIELCDALGHAHSRRVVHRDLKPDNIQLMGDPGRNERVRLLDFGVSYIAADREFSAPAPGSTGVSGTPAYMSPEQIRGDPLDGRSDLYSLGLVLFEMLSGTRAFEGEDPITVCRHQLYTRPPGLASRLPEGVRVPREVSAIIRQLLAKARESRFAGVGAALEAMMSVLPREEWPARFERPRPSRRSTRPLQRPSLHGLPTAEILASHDRARVALLHVELDEVPPDALIPPKPPAALTDVLERWRHVVERGGGMVQQPAARSARAFYGLFRPGRNPAEEAATAAGHALLLHDMVKALAEDLGDPIAFRAGLVLRTHDASDGVLSPLLEDRDADVAFHLARAHDEGAVAVDAGAARVLRERADLEALEPVAAPGLGEAMPAWRIRSLR
ncbi:MAG: serine/threonine-protein kinase [Myxococcota bacterium]